tara:strand:+ start:921 stop:1157 length:237 start_codon:yes stop_codon:yes gene_type:complete
MEYDLKDIDKIVEFKSWNNKKKIDELLRIDCKMYTCLGIDSSLREKEQVRKTSRKIYNHIKKLDYRIGSEFLMAMDKR